MHGITYHLRLLEPILINSLEGDNNTAQSYRFVPGSVIRGLMIGAYLAQRQQMDAAEAEAQRLFFSGATRYLHAYPLAKEDGRRTLPVPLSWRRRKDDSIPDPDKKESPISVFDLSVTPDDGSMQLQSLGADIFWLTRGEQVYQTSTLLQLNVHTQRDALPGRATEEHGAVYRYESLAAGTVLSGVILTASSDDAEFLRKTLLDNPKATLGKARTAGYGFVQFEGVQLLDEDWSETGGFTLNSLPDSSLADDEAAYEGDEENYEESTAEGTATQEFVSECTLTLLSDTLVRDELGQHTLDLLPSLRRWLRKEDGTEPYIESLTVFCRASLLGGFNRKWNLPLPQVTALASGSVFKLKLSTPETFARLLELQKTGIGERRAEGFGRVAVNWHTAGTFDYSKLPGAVPVIAAAAPLSPVEQQQAEQILQRLLRHDLEGKLVEAVNGLHLKGDIPNSQLSRWRAIARSALAQVNLKRLVDFHAAEEKKASAAWERMRRARVEKQSDAGRGHAPRLTDWISDLLVREGQLKTAFGGGLPERQLGGLRVSVTETLEKEYRIRLLDAVLSRKAKQQAKQRAERRRSL